MRSGTPSIVGFGLALGCLAACGCSSAARAPGGNDRGTDAGADIGADRLAACNVTTPSPPPATGDVVRDTAVALAFDLLNRFIGAYLRGDSPSYVGFAAAEDGGDLVDGAPASFSSMSALAAIVVDMDRATLTVASPSDHQRAIFAQDRSSPGTTIGIAVLPDDTYPGSFGQATCMDCAPDFFSRPTALVWDNLVTHFPGIPATAGGFADPPFDIRSTVNLTSLSRCLLTWDQVVVLNGGGSAAGFIKVGDEMVLHESSHVQTVAPSFRQCDGQVVPYTLDAYINLNNLFDYGVRDYQAGTPGFICGGA